MYFNQDNIDSFYSISERLEHFCRSSLARQTAVSPEATSAGSNVIGQYERKPETIQLPKYCVLRTNSVSSYAELLFIETMFCSVCPEKCMFDIHF